MTARLRPCMRDSVYVTVRGACSFSPEDWRIAIAEYKESGIRAVHHSDRYRESEKPAYRIVDYRYIRQLP